MAQRGELSFQDLESLILVLWGDLQTANEEIRAGDTPYRRRAFVRSAITYIEAVAFNLRETIRRTFTAEHCRTAYTETERRLLEDRRALEYVYRDLAERFRFCLEMSAKPFTGKQLIRPGEEPGWEAFRKTVEVRRRITHPESAEALEISTPELYDVQVAIYWTAVKAAASNLVMAEALDTSEAEIRAHRESLTTMETRLSETLERKRQRG
jgi:hypothetical protein